MEGGRFRIALEFGSGRHDGDQNSARREKFDGMIYMVNVSPPVEGRVHDDAIETADQVRCEREKIHRENGLVPLLLLKLECEMGLDFNASYDAALVGCAPGQGTGPSAWFEHPASVLDICFRYDAVGHFIRGRKEAEVSGERSVRSEEHTSELQSLMRISYAVFCLK